MVDTQHPLAGTDQSVIKWRNALQESVWGTRIFRVEKGFTICRSAGWRQSTADHRKTIQNLKTPFAFYAILYNLGILPFERAHN
jgi:hypothetical protein